MAQRNLIPLGISLNLFLKAYGQFSMSSPFWLKNAEVYLSRPTPLRPDQGCSSGLHVLM
jgi:hypothetical protein